MTQCTDKNICGHAHTTAHTQRAGGSAKGKEGGKESEITSVSASSSVEAVAVALPDASRVLLVSADFLLHLQASFSIPAPVSFPRVVNS